MHFRLLLIVGTLAGLGSCQSCVFVEEACQIMIDSSVTIDLRGLNFPLEFSSSIDNNRYLFHPCGEIEACGGAKACVHSGEDYVRLASPGKQLSCEMVNGVPEVVFYGPETVRGPQLAARFQFSCGDKFAFDVSGISQEENSDFLLFKVSGLPCQPVPSRCVVNEKSCHLTAYLTGFKVVLDLSSDKSTLHSFASADNRPYDFKPCGVLGSHPSKKCKGAKGCQHSGSDYSPVGTTAGATCTLNTDNSSFVFEVTYPGAPDSSSDHIKRGTKARFTCDIMQSSLNFTVGANQKEGDTYYYPFDITGQGACAFPKPE